MFLFGKYVWYKRVQIVVIGTNKQQYVSKSLGCNMLWMTGENIERGMVNFDC